MKNVITENTTSAENPITNGVENSYALNPVADELLIEYNKLREPSCRDVLCFAPFKNMYFGHYGKVRSCCYNRKHVWGTYPEQSIKEIWKGTQAELLRTHIKGNDLSLGCEGCKNHMEARHFDGIKTKMYDQAPLNEHYPTVMEFELSNTCNLECIMCSGEFSSSIRSNRDHKPPIDSPYDSTFVSQLEEFIPYLQEVKFYGGEPFLIDIYYEIWDKLVEINPECRISIQTNATILNKRVKELLAKGNFHLNISLDSLDKDNYEAIRINAKFDVVMENIRYFHKYCTSKNTFFGISTCAMQQNWQEIPNFITFCNELNIPVYFHTVWFPVESALWLCDSEKLEEIHNSLLKFNFPETTINERKNKRHFDDFVILIGKWQKDSVRREKHHAELSQLDVKSLQKKFIDKIQTRVVAGNNSESDNKLNNGFAMAQKIVLKLTDKEALLRAVYNIDSTSTDSIANALKNDTEEVLHEKIMKMAQDEVLDNYAI